MSGVQFTPYFTGEQKQLWMLIIVSFANNKSRILAISFTKSNEALITQNSAKNLEIFSVIIEQQQTMLWKTRYGLSNGTLFFH